MSDPGHAPTSDDPVGGGGGKLDARAAAPGMTGQHDPVLTEAVSQVIRILSRVGDRPFDDHGLGRHVGRARHDGRALSPPDHGEMTLRPRGIIRLRADRDHSGTAVQDQQERV